MPEQITIKCKKCGNTIKTLSDVYYGTCGKLLNPKESKAGKAKPIYCSFEYGTAFNTKNMEG